jgi:hypothetical protein
MEDRLGWKCIPDNLIAPVDVAEREAVVARNIEKWFNDVGEAPRRFLHATRSRPEKVNHQFEAVTLLDVLIQSLDAKQLASTTMSLDTISALLKKRI